MKTVEERFWPKVMRKDAVSCWEWSGGYRGDYGMFWLNGQNRGSHCVAYALTHGEIPEGMVVRHECDNRACCNPAHLVLGTPQDNSNDMVERGRVRRGEAVKNAKLTEDMVRDIKDAEGSQRAIAKAFGVSQGTVWQIKQGNYWKHVV